MLFPLFAILYAIAVGYVVAGLLAALHRVVFSLPEASLDVATEISGGMAPGRPASPMIVLHFTTFADKAWSLFVCTFAGPYLLIRYGTWLWRSRRIGGNALAACLAIGVLWSFLSGVVLVELAAYCGLLS
ncbi:MAG: hypothetical protein KDJ80_16015 [Nitratireductor sp.]|nr:hypothetical protein [Nitratireductor sp.]